MMPGADPFGPRTHHHSRDSRPASQSQRGPVTASISTEPSTVPGTRSTGLLSARRDKQATKRFFRKALGRKNTRNPREVMTDRLKSYPGALREMKQKGEL